MSEIAYILPGKLYGGQSLSPVKQTCRFFPVGRETHSVMGSPQPLSIPSSVFCFAALKQIDLDYEVLCEQKGCCVPIGDKAGVFNRRCEIQDGLPFSLAESEVSNLNLAQWSVLCSWLPEKWSSSTIYLLVSRSLVMTVITLSTLGIERAVQPWPGFKCFRKTNPAFHGNDIASF